MTFHVHPSVTTLIVEASIREKCECAGDQLESVKIPPPPPQNL